MVGLPGLWGKYTDLTGIGICAYPAIRLLFPDKLNHLLSAVFGMLRFPD